jgi:hypothetical protein
VEVEAGESNSVENRLRNNNVSDTRGRVRVWAWNKVKREWEAKLFGH